MSDNLHKDLLSDILTQYQLRAEVYANPSVCGNWRVNTRGSHRAGFHMVCTGGCWLHLSESDEPRWLGAGDIVFLPHDEWHVLSPHRELDDDSMKLVNDGDGPVTTLTCGSVRFHDREGESLLGSLSGPVVLRAADSSEPMAQQSLAHLLAIEAGQERPGRQTLLDRLAEVVFVMVLRQIVEKGNVSTGLLAGLGDRHLRRALQAIHSDWRRPWQLEELAEVAGLARSTFARRFKQVVGQAPMHYVDGWRMWHAEQYLAGGRHSVAAVAEMLDYASEAAFRRAFSRVRGITTGRVRRQSITQDD